MLIYSDRYPGWGKQKPKQWGPLSAVQSAVRYNAERMGIDPSTIAVVLPFWEAAGNPQNILSLKQDGNIVSDPTWNGDGSIDGEWNACYSLPTYDKLTFFTLTNTAPYSYNTGGQVLSVGSYSTGGRYTIDFRQTGGVDRLDLARWNNNGENTEVWTADVGEHLIGVATDFSTGALNFYGDGSLVGQLSRTPYTPETGNEIVLEESSGTAKIDNNSGYDHPTYFFYLIRDFVAPDVAARIYETPYCLLIPPPRILYFDVAATGIPTLSNPSFTGRIPSVDLAF